MSSKIDGLIIIDQDSNGVMVFYNSHGSVRFPNGTEDSLDVSAIQEILTIEARTLSVGVELGYSQVTLIGSIKIDSLTEDSGTTGILVQAVTSF
jgi:hypothetical protein